ncbi:hypothetical protein D3C73_1232490 [compost metagenome]
MTVLTHLSDQNARAAAVIGEKFFSLRNNGVKLVGGFFRLVVALRNHSGDTLAGYQVTVKSGLQCVRDFTQRGANARGIYCGGEQVFIVPRRVGQSFQRGFHRNIVTGRADVLQRGNLLVAHLDVVDFQYRRGVFFIQLVFVHANDNALSLVDE